MSFAGKKVPFIQIAWDKKKDISYKVQQNFLVLSYNIAM